MPINSLTYSIPYLLYLMVLVGLMFVEFRRIKLELDTSYIRWLTILSFLIFFGLRGFVFTDWIIYYSIFDKLPTIWDGGLESLMNVSEAFEADLEVGKAGYEMGFIVTTFIFKSLIPNYFVWMFANVLVDIWLLDKFIRRFSPYYVMAFVVFIAMGGLLIECNLIRNIKAILLFMISLKYLEERRLLSYLILNGIGVLFHSSAIIFLPLYFFLHKECPKWLMWAIFILGNVIFLLQIGYLQPLMLSFADMVGGRLGVQIKIYFALDLYSQPYGISIGYLERLITFLLLIVFKDALIERSKHNIILINIYIVYFIIFFYFSEVRIAVDRLTLLFIFSYWVLFPQLYQLIRHITVKWAVVSIIILFCGLKTSLLSSNIFARYDNLLTGIESYEVRLMHHDNNVDKFVEEQYN